MKKNVSDRGICRRDGLRIKISREEVFGALNCNQESESYQIFSEEYEEIKNEVESVCHPVILAQPEERSRLYALYTIGREPEKLSTKAFSEGDYVRGMLINAMADSALFSLERELEKILLAFCREQRLGIKERLEAPADIPMETQRTVYETVKAAEYGIGISEGCMFDPVKSQAVIFLMTEDTGQMRMHHECAGCDNFGCPKRHAERLTVKVTYEGADIVQMTECRAGENLLAILQKAGVCLPAPCGGRGRCGKCRVRIEKGRTLISKEEKEALSREQLEQGWRLACRAVVQMNLEILLPQSEENFWVLNAQQDVCDTLHKKDTCKIQNKSEPAGSAAQDWGIAIDLGTTTIAMQRISIPDGAVLDTWNGVNHQRSYGADVISRIEASVKGQKLRLQECIRRDLAEGICCLALRAGGYEGMKGAALAGNTVMIHLLRGYDCTGLMGVPFEPESLGEEKHSLRELIAEDLPDITVYLFPGMASFVGGDITAGTYACGFEHDKRIRMLIDLGTNGEMVLTNSAGLLCASTAAGPAFEGGRISWGMGSLPGAIQGVDIREGKAHIKVLGEKACSGKTGAEKTDAGKREGVGKICDLNVYEVAAGICGTGVLEAAAALYELGYMDETGRLEEAFFEKGYPLAMTSSGELIRITQQDIREIQLAKAAIRAGIDTLLYRGGISAEQVEEVCLAGGFGFALDCEKAIAVKLFPEEFRGRIRIVGNSSLNGCIRWLLERDAGVPKCLSETAKELNLSADAMFQQYYIEGMMFGED